MDFGSLMGMMGPPPSQATRRGTEAEDDVSDIVSLDLGDPDMREVNLGEKKKRGPKAKGKKEVSL